MVAQAAVTALYRSLGVGALEFVRNHRLTQLFLYWVGTAFPGGPPTQMLGHRESTEPQVLPLNIALAFMPASILLWLTPCQGGVSLWRIGRARTTSIVP